MNLNILSENLLFVGSNSWNIEVKESQLCYEKTLTVLGQLTFT